MLKDIADIDNVDINKQLTQQISDIREFIVLNAIINGEIDLYNESVNNLYKDQYILTATLDGLKYREEKIMKTKSLYSQNVEQKRSRVLAEYNDKLPYTRLFLEERIKSIIGQDSYSKVTIYNNEYTIDIDIGSDSNEFIEEIKRIAQDMKPANMLLNIYNTLVKPIMTMVYIKPYNYSSPNCGADRCGTKPLTSTLGSHLTFGIDLKCEEKANNYKLYECGKWYVKTI